MKFKNLLLAALILGSGNMAMAKKEAKQPDSYAYTRGIECLNDEKYEDAMDWFQKAPLLLGQSVLGRLGKIEIDNPNMKLVITHKINNKNLK